MAIVTPLRRTAEDLLVECESPRTAGALRDLRRCLDAQTHRVLTDPELHLLHAGPWAGQEGAAARVAEPDALLLLLPLFLEDALLAGDPVGIRRRARLVSRLADRVVGLPELRHADLAAAVEEVDAALDRARLALEAADGRPLRLVPLPA